MWLHALTILIGAALLFWIQLLEGRYLLSWFGGGAWVWTTCMLFFQVGLLLGYALALQVAKARRWSGLTVMGLLLGVGLFGLFSVGIVPSEGARPAVGDSPWVRLFATLGMYVGLPFVLLATSAPLLQDWAAASREGRTPWVLYAVSNLGALVVLLGYPFVIEPVWTRLQQARAWVVGYVVWTALVLLLGWRRTKYPDAPRLERSEADLELSRPALTWDARALWILLPALSSAAMLAVTTVISHSVAPTPLLWVVPLAIYLASFVIAFQGEGLYPRRLLLLAWVPLAALSIHANYGAKDLSFARILSTQCTFLLISGWVCHGELFALRPGRRGAPAYYLAIAAGGALGGLAISVGAPLWLSTNLELQLLIVVLALVLVWLSKRRATPGWIPAVGVALALLLAGYVTIEERKLRDGAVQYVRGPYATLAVYEIAKDDPEQHRRVLVNGVTSHGWQFQSEDRKREPTAYYTLNSGVGLAAAWKHNQKGGGKRVGVIGLGIGVLASYAVQGDTWRFYELDPTTIQLAEESFEFLSFARSLPASVEVIAGDARCSLESEPNQSFDLLVVDAFVGDTVPVHLLTKEAFDLYCRHLAVDGILALHLSSSHLDFRPLIGRLAAEQKIGGLWIERARGVDGHGYPSDWALMTRDRSFLSNPRVLGAAQILPAEGPLWTDEHAPIVSIVR